MWLVDPQRITYQPQTWWWDLLRGLRTVEDAHRLAGHFVLTVADEHRRDLWGPAAQDLLAALFLGASSSGHTLHDVAGWLNEPAVPTPVELLAEAGFTAMAASLRGAQNGAAETRDGIYQTARTAAKAMTDPDIMAWVTPPRRIALPVFDPDDFAASRDTLYLLSKSRSAAAPLIAALPAPHGRVVMLNHLSERIRLPDRSVVWLGVHPAEVMFGKEMGLVVAAMERLSASERREVVSELMSRLGHHRGTAALRKRLEG